MRTTKQFGEHVVIRGKCSCCKQCWFYLNGTCIYGGPYAGYEKQEEPEGKDGPEAHKS